MKSTDKLIDLRGLALATAALAVLPLSANAMLTDHDVLKAASDPNVVVSKQQSDTRDEALTKRFGAYSGIGTQDSEKSSSRLSARNDLPTEKTLYLR